MDAQTYSNVTAACDQIAAKTRDPGISALSSRLHRALEKEHKPTMALVSFNMNHAERFAIIKDFTGADIPGELAARVDGAPACILFDFSSTAKLVIGLRIREVFFELSLPAAVRGKGIAWQTLPLGIEGN